MRPPGTGRPARRHVTGARRRMGGKSDVTRPTVATALTAAALSVAVTIALGGAISRAEQRIRADLRDVRVEVRIVRTDLRHLGERLAAIEATREDRSSAAALQQGELPGG